MIAFQIEAALERCRLAFTREDYAEARRKLDETQTLIKKTEKPYVLHIPDWDAWDRRTTSVSSKKARSSATTAATRKSPRSMRR